MTTLLHCSNHRAKRPPLRRQDIFGARRVLLVEMALDDPGLLEPLQPRGQRIRADAGQRPLEILEFPRSFEQQVAQDQDRPALADDVDRTGDRTVHVVIGRHHGWITAACRSRSISFLH